MIERNVILIKFYQLKESFAEVVATVKHMQLKRYVSTYKISYCNKHSTGLILELFEHYLFHLKNLISEAVIPRQEQEMLENNLSETCNLLYNKKIAKVLPTLKTCRRSKQCILNE